MIPLHVSKFDFVGNISDDFDNRKLFRRKLAISAVSLKRSRRDVSIGGTRAVFFDGDRACFSRASSFGNVINHGSNPFMYRDTAAWQVMLSRRVLRRTSMRQHT